MPLTLLLSYLRHLVKIESTYLFHFKMDPRMRKIWSKGRHVSQEHHPSLRFHYLHHCQFLRKYDFCRYRYHCCHFYFFVIFFIVDINVIIVAIFICILLKIIAILVIHRHISVLLTQVHCEFSVEASTIHRIINRRVPILGESYRDKWSVLSTC